MRRVRQGPPLVRRVKGTSPRSGAILVVVAGGLIALLTFAAFAVDLGYFFLSRSQLNSMATAAAMAGYEQLKRQNFAYTTVADKDAVNGMIRRFLRENGATTAESNAASIEVSKRGKITVIVDRDVPYFFGALTGRRIQAVGGSGVLQANNLAPFAVPSTYQDPDQNGLPNWDVNTHDISLTPTPWEWKVNNPYIIKYGEPEQVGPGTNFIYIPMDDGAVNVTLPSGTFEIPAQDSTCNSIDTDTGDSDCDGAMCTGSAKGKADRDDDNFDVRGDCGLLLAYGIAYKVLGLTGSDEAPVNWLLGYNGGAFLVSEQALLDAGFTFSPALDATVAVNGSHRTTIQYGGASAHTTAVVLKANWADPLYRAKDAEFVNHLVALANTSPRKINILDITYQPQIATFTENSDMVTAAMYAAGIPFTAFYLDSGSPYPRTMHEAAYMVDPKTESTADIRAKLDDFDWLHLHHEDFIRGYGSPEVHYADKANLVRAIYEFVTIDHKFLMAVCWAAETLETALMYLSSVDAGTWDSTIYDPDAHAPFKHYHNKPTVDGGNLRYDKTFATKDFLIGDDYGEGPMRADNTWDSNPTSGGHQNDSSTYLDLPDQGNSDDDANLSVKKGWPCDNRDTSFGGDPDCLDYDGGIATFPVATYCPSAVNCPDPRRDAVDAGSSNTSLDGDLYQNPFNLDDSKTSEIDGEVNGIRFVLGDYLHPLLQNHRGFAGLDLNEAANPPVVGTFSNTDYITSASGALDSFRHGRLPISLTSVRSCSNPTSTDPTCSELLKPHVAPQLGITEPSRVTTGAQVFTMALGTTSNPSNPPTAFTTSNNSIYLAGTGDDDTSLDNGFGRWAYITGHWVHYDASNRVSGARLYLNNILFGATVESSVSGPFIPNSGAINPGQLPLGNGAGQYGATNLTGNSYGTTFKLGTKKLPMPVGAQFTSAPGSFAAQTADAQTFMFVDPVTTTRISSTWEQFKLLSTDAKLSHPQTIKVAMVERIPNGTAVTPTPYDDLMEYMDSSNTAREKSMYAGVLPVESTTNVKDLHVIGYMNFFVIDQLNQDPTTQSPATSDSYVASEWRNGEVRGYFLGYFENPITGTIYPVTPAEDPRDN